MPNRLPDIDSVRLESPMAPALPCRNAQGRYVVRMSEWQRAHARAVHTHRFLNGSCRRHDFKRAFSCVQAALPRSIVVRNNRFRKRDRNVNLQSSVTTVFLFYEPKSLYKPEVSETKWNTTKRLVLFQKTCESFELAAMPMAVGAPGDGNPQRRTVSPTRSGRKYERSRMRMRPCMSMRSCSHMQPHAKPCFHGTRAWHVSCSSFAWNSVRVSINYSYSYYIDARK